jgi:3-oxoadipate enol-lactonase
MAQALHQGIASSSLTVLPGARHLTPLERPADIVAALEGLLRQARTA